ncbi:MAG: AbrB/MazE/SpoVT family DNA-binding domain-containing protein [Candidatus Latescibacterota bacterium]|jgi:AbrB family looped-hinge helix DNA binding protein
MESAKASSKGQMVIPKSIRQALGIRSGTTLGIELLPDQAFKVSIRPTDQVALVRQLAGSLAHRGQQGAARWEDAAVLEALLADDERTRARPGRRR